LTANTTYYVRAYATTAKGVTYGDAVTFTTFSNINYISMEIWWPNTSIEPVDQYLYDLDGDGVFAPDDWYPVVPLKSNGVHSVYFFGIGHVDGETYTSYLDEIETDKSDYLVCFEVTNGAATIAYKDQDSNALPVGLHTEWTAGAVGKTGQIKIKLRYLQGVKTATCPGTGETEFEIIIPVEVK
jgi:hypothetical protein